MLRRIGNEQDKTHLKDIVKREEWKGCIVHLLDLDEPTNGVILENCFLVHLDLSLYLQRRTPNRIHQVMYLLLSLHQLCTRYALRHGCRGNTPQWELSCPSLAIPGIASVVPQLSIAAIDNTGTSSPCGESRRYFEFNCPHMQASKDTFTIPLPRFIKGGQKQPKLISWKWCYNPNAELEASTSTAKTSTRIPDEEVWAMEVRNDKWEREARMQDPLGCPCNL